MSSAAASAPWSPPQQSWSLSLLPLPASERLSCSKSASCTRTHTQTERQRKCECGRPRPRRRSAATYLARADQVVAVDQVLVVVDLLERQRRRAVRGRQIVAGHLQWRLGHGRGARDVRRASRASAGVRRRRRVAAIAAVASRPRRVRRADVLGGGRRGHCVLAADVVVWPLCTGEPVRGRRGARRSRALHRAAREVCTARGGSSPARRGTRTQPRRAERNALCAFRLSTLVSLSSCCGPRSSSGERARARSLSLWSTATRARAAVDRRVRRDRAVSDDRRLVSGRGVCHVPMVIAVVSA